MRETDLYPPVKNFLEGQGYTVKGEIEGCDVVAVRGGEPPVIVELKASFTLALVLQGVRRLALSDAVYVAVPPFSGKTPRQRRRDIVGLCRRLQLGLMTVRTGCGQHPFVEVLTDPGEYRPRANKQRQGRLLGEFAHRVGDPTAGGSSTAAPRMTAYRQDALRCAVFLASRGQTKAAIVAQETSVPRAASILQRDVYGWFERVDRGIYALSPKGTDALQIHADALSDLTRNE